MKSYNYIQKILISLKLLSNSLTFKSRLFLTYHFTRTSNKSLTTGNRIFKPIKNIVPLLYLIIACSFFPIETQAQTINQQNLTKLSDQIYYNPESKIPSYIKFKSEFQFPFNNLKTWLKSYYALDDNFDLKLLTSEVDQLGYTHYRYQQLYKGIPVEQTMYIVHTLNNKVVSMNGLLYDHFQGGANQLLNKEEALKAALKFVNAKTYMWQNTNNEKQIKEETDDPSASWFPKGELTYMAKDNMLNAKQNKLTYKFDVYVTEPMSRQYIYVDVQSNEVIAHFNRIHTSDTLVTAKTAMSGDQRIYVDYAGANSFRLREANRGNGIETYNLQKGTNYGSAVDFTDADTTWNNVNGNYDEYATDAHFGSQMTYDFYKENFNRNSIDNNGFKLTSYIHYSSNYANAFWNGSYMTYGDGNGSNIYPLVSLDIAGHEITHGLTSLTANLTYSDESGALNESFSDILGTAIEWYGDSTHFEWDLGTKIGSTIRSLANPESKGQPDTYKGTNWYVGAADNGGVHTNSGVQNYWYYLLCNGGSGTNDNGDTYAVNLIGMAKANAIAYRTLTYYLTSSSQYIDARKYSIIAAEDLYGPCSDEMLAVAAAWHAVGVGYKLAYTSQAVLTQNTNNIIPSSTDNVILRINVLPSCSDTDTATVFSFNTLGTTRPINIKRAKLYYTGSNATFNAASQFGSTKNSPSGVFTFIDSRPLLKNSDNYFWLTYDVDTAKVGEVFDATCSYIQVDTTVIPIDTNPSGNREIGYCIPSMSIISPCTYMHTSNVQIDSINNSSGCSDSSYRDYSNLITTRKIGETVNYNFTVSGYNQYINVWIDYNHDGHLDYSELVVNNQLTNSYTASGSFTIPESAQIGKTRIRIMADYYSLANQAACDAVNYGETEDYSI
ncbi:MAG: M4 family metallopeptidase, partial [Bacteroidetes bacterium]|nr:M4 family metallopeptidase [Bacteroidota bacterium]